MKTVVKEFQKTLIRYGFTKISVNSFASERESMLLTVAFQWSRDKNAFSLHNYITPLALRHLRPKKEASFTHLRIDHGRVAWVAIVTEEKAISEDLENEFAAKSIPFFLQNDVATIIRAFESIKTSRLFEDMPFLLTLAKRHLEAKEYAEKYLAHHISHYEQVTEALQEICAPDADASQLVAHWSSQARNELKGLSNFVVPSLRPL